MQDFLQSPLEQRILNFMQSPVNESSTDDFSQLALDLWKYQVEQNVAYGRFCSSIQATTKIAPPTRWQDIPAVPVALFRDLTFTCFPPVFAKHCFRTSGTTGPRGAHYLLDSTVYDVGATLGMQRVVSSVPNIGLSLVSPSADSSLGHMCRLFAPSMQQGFLSNIGVLVEDSWKYLREATEAIFIPTTSFALASLVHPSNIPSDEPCWLPEGSIMMITGGFKGKTVDLDEEELSKRVRHLFPNCRIVGEYGMTELSSQLWSPSIDDRFIPPPWLKVLAVDPQTGQETKGVGQLRFVDLANHQTVLAIETRDMGIVHEDGTMTLLGRLPQSDVRGCSLSVEEVDALFTTPSTAPPKKQCSHQKTVVEHQRSMPIDAVQAALNALYSVDPNNTSFGDISQGIHKNTALWGWKHSLDNITHGLKSATQLIENAVKPEQISLVVARGVFTSSLEWIVLALLSGGTLHIKGTSEEFHATQFFCEHFASYGLPVTHSTDRQLPPSDLLWAFGSQATIETIGKNQDYAYFQGYGHRFSFAITSGNRESNESDARRFADDILAYDGRGCMAPVGIFCLGDVENFMEELSIALQEKSQEKPSGLISPYLAPEKRRRIGLAAQLGYPLYLREGHSVLAMDSKHFYPHSFPRMACVYPVQSIAEVEKILLPWSSMISTIGLGKNLTFSTKFSGRICALGTMQIPPFPRKHDGIAMWPNT